MFFAIATNTAPPYYKALPLADLHHAMEAYAEYVERQKQARDHQEAKHRKNR